MKLNDLLVHGAEAHQAKVGKLKVEVEHYKSKLSNGVFLKEACQLHPDFDGFAKDFSDVGFKFLMKGIKEVAPEFDLEPIKLRYAEKWASGPNKTPDPQSLVDRYLKDLNSEVEDDEDDDEEGLSQEGDAAGTTQEDNKVDPPAFGVNSSQEVGVVDSQELDLLESASPFNCFLIACFLHCAFL